MPSIVLPLDQIPHFVILAIILVTQNALDEIFVLPIALDGRRDGYGVSVVCVICGVIGEVSHLIADSSSC